MNKFTVLVFAGLLLFALLLPPCCAGGHDALLDKAFESLRWFDGLSSITAKQHISPKVYREKISPLELLQAIVIFQEQKSKEKTDIAMLLAPMLPYFAVTPEEAFGLLDQIDEKAWEDVAELDPKFVTKIKEDAAKFRKEMLNAAETAVLLNEPENAADIFRAADIIAVTGRPVIVRHYLKKFLESEKPENNKFRVTPKEAAKIVKTVGSNNLMRMAVNEKFDPFGRDAVVLLIKTAAEYQEYRQNEEKPSQDKSAQDKPAQTPPSFNPRQPIESLAKATVAQNRRLRFSALQAVMNLKPSQPYAGSSLVAETLIWFSKADGERIIVTAHPKISAASEIGSYFMPLGYKNIAAATCREALQAASDSPDVELVILDDITQKPPLADFLATMRNDCRTAEIPVAVLTGNRETLKWKSEALKLNNDPAAEDNVSLAFSQDTPARVYPRLTNEKSARWLRDDLVTKTGYDGVPPKERLEQARQALVWLKEIAEEARQGCKIYHFDDLEPVVFNALASNVRMPEGLDLAASLKSESMQKVLYEIAANIAVAMPARATAAAAFERSVKMHGVLLRGKNRQYVYDRYNAGAHETKESQELLHKMLSIVDAGE
ncbi:MAG: hypothetical protein LBT46_03130 [Planctomycetaceae bacterium]|jgi:CheY-like chemotaxis protein|nr:hypothetical protein [Planctomycetaceae bacterium]